MTAVLQEQEINVMQLWLGILKLLRLKLDIFFLFFFL